MSVKSTGKAAADGRGNGEAQQLIFENIDAHGLRRHAITLNCQKTASGARIDEVVYNDHGKNSNHQDQIVF